MVNDIVTFLFVLYSIDLRETSFILSYVLLKYCIEKCGFKKFFLPKAKRLVRAPHL